MRKKKITILIIGILAGFTHYAVAGETKKVTCKGKLLDAQGRPVAGAKVTAYEMLLDGIAGNILLRPAGEIITAEDGAFIFSTEPKPKRGVFLGCKIVAVKSDLALGWTEWTMREGAQSDIQLGAPEKLGGVIVDEAGKPVASAEVRANPYRTIKSAEGKEERQWLPGIGSLQELCTQTDSQGKFLFRNLPADVGVDLLVTAAGRATTYTYKLELGGPAFTTGQMDIKVTLPAEARVEGKIVDPDTGEGIAGIKFAIVATSSGLFYYRFVHTTNNDGTFSVGGLQTDRYLLRGGGLPNTYVDVKSGLTAKVTVRANKPYYVRILFEDSNPVVIEPVFWPGAKIRISFVEEGKDSRSVGILDKEGFVTIYLSREQYQQARLGKAWFEILIPYTDKRTYHQEDVFVYDLLATDKAKAGVATIAKLKTEPNTLVGKLLPNPKALGIDLSGKNVRNKRVLVCFWDMNQRPSRNYLLRLAKQAEELKQKGLIVIAVQASQVKTNDLNAWLKKNHIPFLVGMIQSDEEKSRFMWGVTSLPWLILTDREHVITAEGFALRELDDKLKTN